METQRKFRVVVETDNPRLAYLFISMARKAADRATVRADRDFWRGLANGMMEQCLGVFVEARNQVLRPREDDEVALGLVIEGKGTYPVLSVMDARRVVIHFGHRLSARELAERLYVDRRTVSRWRTEYKKGMWKKYGL